MDVVFINDIRMGNVLIGADRWGRRHPQYLSITLQLHIPVELSTAVEKKDTLDTSSAWQYIFDSYELSSKNFGSLLDFTEFVADSILTKYNGRVSAVRAIVEIGRAHV